MTATYDVSTDVGKMRLMIPDRDLVNALFTDEELTALLDAEFGFVKRGAALALETIASDRVMVLQVITTNGLTTDGAAVSNAILKRAAALRVQASNEEAAIEGGAFDWAEQVTGNFSYRERQWSEIMRTES